MKSALNQMLVSFLAKAKSHGLHDRDYKIAKEYLAHLEYGLCFEMIVTQLYEFDIKIDQETMYLINAIGEMMQMPTKSYLFANELVQK
jgi:hypothetical protein